LLDHSWTLTVVSPLIVVIVLLLEQVHERHADWRMNRQEFFTDLFYVVLGATLITWCTTKLAEDPLLAIAKSASWSSAARRRGWRRRGGAELRRRLPISRASSVPCH